jgi:hypothetical protein
VALIAAEHTAQLNSASADEVFSTAEENELLFQDVEIPMSGSGGPSMAVDLLSCTTTMEVGIDIGQLAAVALRNMPPSRANYQQRSGRAGRRGMAIATVVAFGSADSHDEQYFRNPDGMIRGPVDDPRLVLDNLDIVKRHMLAFLLQRYHQDAIPSVRPDQQPQLFAVLGTVGDFLQDGSIISLTKFEAWLTQHLAVIRSELDQWLPQEVEPTGTSTTPSSTPSTGSSSAARSS